MSGRHAREHGGPAGDLTSPVHGLDPRAKIVGLVAVTAVGVSAPVSAWPVWIGCAAVLAAVAAVGRIPPAVVLRRAGIVLPLVLAAAILIPFAREGETAFSIGPFDASVQGLQTLLSVAVKAAIGTVSSVLLAATTSVPSIIRGLEAMRVPRLPILVATFMYRYLFVVADELGRMRSALASRAYRPRHLLAIRPLGRMVAALFLRSYARGERVHTAMLARGFTGEMPRLEPLRPGRSDAVFVALVAVALLPLRALLEVSS